MLVVEKTETIYKHPESPERITVRVVIVLPELFYV